MESSTEILRVAAAIVSAFQTAADTLEIIKDRKEKKKRKKDKDDVEELLELRILHRSLVEGGTRCRKHCENRHRQYSPAFEAGDEIAIAALRDVLNAMHTEVIQALHIARAVESSVLQFTSLHESSVTSCRDATRAMDQLCQRIMASMQFQPQRSVNTSEAPSVSSTRSGFASMGLSDLIESYDLPPTPPASLGSPQSPYYQRPLPPVPQRTSTITHSSDMSSQRGRYNPPQISPQGWPGRRAISQGNPASQEKQSIQNPEGSEMERSQFSMQYLAPGSDRGSLYTQPASSASESHSRYYQGTSTRDQANYDQAQQLSQQRTEQPQQLSQQRTEQSQQLSQQWPTLIEEKTALASALNERDNGYTFGRLALPTPEAEASALLSQTTRLPRIETAQEHMRALEAPEVLNPSPLRPRPDLSSEKYPAFRTQTDYEDILRSLPAGTNNVWQPLARPAMHNRYQGFCKGAWQIRKAVHEGLDVQLTPSLKESVIHWACKVCKFRSKAPNADTLPDQILFNQKYNVRYRWLFLAKSHRETEDPSGMVENYKYGCIFCAAQGKTTASHEKLEHLIVHIISKHKSTMMTPEIKGKTKCIVGGVAKGTANWDIIVPESNQKGSSSVVADEFFISASKFFNRRKGKGS